jgi:hypothetical protein
MNLIKRKVSEKLIHRSKIAAAQAKLILLEAPEAVNYYPGIGMTKMEQCCILDDIDALK